MLTQETQQTGVVQLVKLRIPGFLVIVFFPAGSEVQLQLNHNGYHAPAETNVGAEEEKQVNSSCNFV